MVACVGEEGGREGREGGGRRGRGRNGRGKKEEGERGEREKLVLERTQHTFCKRT